MSEQDGVAVNRTVRFPRSISEQARATLQMFAGSGHGPLGKHRPYPPPDDLAAWREYKLDGKTGMEALTSQMMAQFSGSIETIMVGGVTTHVATPATPFNQDLVYLDIHGGGLVIGDGESCKAMAANAAGLHGVRAYSVDYRMPPEHPYPAALDDCVAVYRQLLSSHSPENIIIGGVSAGGNLAAATVLRARDEGLPLPAAVVLITPELDLTESGDSFETNQLLDVVLPLPLMNANLLYADGHDLAHPYLSPLFGDFAKGFPPTLLQAGTRDLFLSNAARMQRNLRRAGVPVELLLCEGMPHGGFFGAPEDVELAGDTADFVARHWGRRT